MESVHLIQYLIRSTSNPMDKGACNSVHYQYYGRNSNMASSVTMFIIFFGIKFHLYNWLHHSYTQQGYTECAATPSSSVKVVNLL